LAVAYQKVGDAQGDPWGPSLGYTDAAMKSYQQSLTLAQKLAAQEDAPLHIRRVLALSYFKLGALQAESGDWPGANATLRQALSVAEPLAQQTGDPKDMVVLENTYDRLGDTQLDTGDAAGALQSYRRTQQWTERRAAEHPSDSAQVGVALCHTHIGETLAAMGDLVGGIENYRQALSIFEAMVKKHPSNFSYRRNLAVTYNWLGRLSGNPQSINLGDRTTALQFYRQGLAITEKLVAEDPKSGRARLDLANSYEKVGGMISDADPVQGAEYLRKALAIIHGLLDLSPNEFRYLRQQALYLRTLAAPLQKLGDHQGALRNLRQSLAQLQALSAKDPA
jgi:tetratricopeptide (TPR) repeat protein